jgi:hypothetical protein
MQSAFFGGMVNRSAAALERAGGKGAVGGGPLGILALGGTRGANGEMHSRTRLNSILCAEETALEEVGPLEFSLHLESLRARLPDEARARRSHIYCEYHRGIMRRTRRLSHTQLAHPHPVS